MFTEIVSPSNQGLASLANKGLPSFCMREGNYETQSPDSYETTRALSHLLNKSKLIVSLPSGNVNEIVKARYEYVHDLVSNEWRCRWYGMISDARNNAEKNKPTGRRDEKTG